MSQYRLRVAAKCFVTDTVGVYLIEQVDRTTSRFITPRGPSEPIKEGCFYAENVVDDKALCRLDPNEVQILMNELWDSGWRPTSGVSSAGLKEANASEIGYMRSVIDRLLSIRHVKR